MSKSDTIRELARLGLAPAEIARRVGVRYQFVYNVLKASNGQADRAAPASTALPVSSKPLLTTTILLSGGFREVGHWRLAGEDLRPCEDVPKARGVYAFVRGDHALYVGVSTSGLARRLHFYARPGMTQRTSQRIGAALKETLREGAEVAIYIATPPDLEWNGLPVAGDAGLEIGLIQSYRIPWNIRSAVGR